ncbi:hypothetical protein [uncultured Cellulomonas sp.]|uniref:hypothetical protein n=1 Tax=uncultured Cellulomonas sp. TaxID=189682 RepID=UPI0028E32BDA|nr:hypothetical protein [uncultured Cellulomonas sp.]
MIPAQDAATAQALGVRPDASDELYQLLAAKEFADRLGSRRRAAGAPIRTIFVADETALRTPLATLLSGPESGGGGRGGQLRVKLYLSLLWICAKKPYDVARPARAWAALLGLPDHEGSGVRRIQQAFRDLESRGFIQLQEQGGRPSNAVLRSERGDGTAFVPAPEAHSVLQKNNADEAALREHRYFRVPSTLWTDGHIARLKGPSLAMLLALLSERRGAESGAVWFSPERARERFGIATSTRREGLEHLRELGLVTTTSRIVSENGAYIDWARRRNVHEVVGL